MTHNYTVEFNINQRKGRLHDQAVCYGSQEEAIKNVHAIPGPNPVP